MRKKSVFYSPNLGFFLGEQLLSSGPSSNHPPTLLLVLKKKGIPSGVPGQVPGNSRTIDIDVDGSFIKN